MSVDILLFNLALSFALAWVINLLGRGSGKYGYTTLVRLYETSQLGFNILFRILAPALIVGVVSVILYQLQLEWLVEDIWLSVLFYWVNRAVYIVYRGWFRLIPRRLFVFQGLSSLALTYYFYSRAYSQGIDYILPQGADVSFQLWLLGAVFVYNLANSHRPTGSAFELKKKELRRRYSRARERYGYLLGERFRQDPALRIVFYTFLLLEDFNRSDAVRRTERLLFRFGWVGTTGVMQVQSDKALTDNDSVLKAMPIVEGLYDDFLGSIMSDDSDTVRSAPEYEDASACFSPNDRRSRYDFIRERLPSQIESLYASYRGERLDTVFDMYLLVAEFVESEEGLYPGSPS